jgi:hypothetical protein
VVIEFVTLSWPTLPWAGFFPSDARLKRVIVRYRDLRRDRSRHDRAGRNAIHSRDYEETAETRGEEISTRMIARFLERIAVGVLRLAMQ